MLTKFQQHILMNRGYGCFQKWPWIPPFKLVSHSGNWFEKWLASQTSCISHVTFWHRNTQGVWIFKYFPKVQNIWKLIPDSHSYLLVVDSLKLFWYACVSACGYNLIGVDFRCLLKKKNSRTQSEEHSQCWSRDRLADVQEEELVKKTGQRDLAEL